MTDWPVVPLRELAIEMQPGFACQPTGRDHGYPQLRTNNVSSQGKIDLDLVKFVPAKKSQISKYSLLAGDVLFNNTNSPALVGKTALFDGEHPYLFSNHMTRVRVKRGLIEPGYLARFLHREWKVGAFRSLVTQWVSQAAINRDQLGSVLVPLPALSEQRRIVEIFDQADHLCRLRAAASTMADRILPALFLKMFGDPATNAMGWPIRPLGELGELDRGRSRHRPRNDPALLGGDHPLIQTGDVANSNGRIREYTQTYSDVGLSQSKMWKAGTLCITIAANIANTAVLEFDACFPDSVVGFTPGPCVTTEYVQFLLGHLKPVLERNAPMVAQKNINLGVLRELPVPNPPMDLQSHFSEAVECYWTGRSNQWRSQAHLERLSRSLNTQAFAGVLTRRWRRAHSEQLIRECDARDAVLRKA